MENVLKGNKVTIRPPSIKDLEICYYWEYEEKNQEFVKWNSPFEANEETQTLNEFIDEWSGYEIFPNVPGMLVIEADGQVIGEVDADWVDKHNNWIEIGIIIYNPKYWSSGYGTEAFSLFIDYMFINTPLHRIGISTWSGNMRMIKTAKRLGMIEEGRIRQTRMVDGKFYDAIRMGMLRSEWDSFKTTKSPHN